MSQQGLCVKPLLGGTIPRWPVCAGQLSCLVHRHSARRSGRSHGCTLTSDVGGAAERAKAGGLGGTHMTAVVGMHMGGMPCLVLRQSARGIPASVSASQRLACRQCQHVGLFLFLRRGVASLFEAEDEAGESGGSAQQHVYLHRAANAPCPGRSPLAASPVTLNP